MIFYVVGKRQVLGTAISTVKIKWQVVTIFDWTSFYPIFVSKTNWFSTNKLFCGMVAIIFNHWFIDRDTIVKHSPLQELHKFICQWSIFNILSFDVATALVSTTWRFLFISQNLHIDMTLLTNSTPMSSCNDQYICSWGNLW